MAAHQGRVCLLGAWVDPVDQAMAVQTILDWCNTRAQRYVVTPNLDHCRQLASYPALRRAYRAAGLVLADGWPLVLASKFTRRPLRSRVTGADLILPLCDAAASAGHSVYLLGARAEVLAETVRVLREKFPSLNLVGTDAPPFGFDQDPAALAAIEEKIRTAKPDILFVAFGAPKQELWMAQYVATLPIGAAIGVGAGLDFIAGHVVRAPKLWQRVGLEWAWRVVREPKRLAARYGRCLLVLPSLFLAHLWQHFVLQRGLDGGASPAASWPDYLAMLGDQFGEAALGCRHEIYFLHGKKYFGGRPYALAALVRDFRLLLRAEPTQTPRLQAIAVATLAGPSGYDTLARAMAALGPGHSVHVVAHPRLSLAAVSTLPPAPIRWRDGLAGFRTALPMLRQRSPMLRRSIVFCCVWRAHLWQASWRAFHAAHPQLRTVLLHNDFDMMSSTAVSVFAPDLRVICLQHGIPTDEFFPTHAPVQILWGNTSREAYQAQHSTATLVIDALGRGANLPKGEPPIPQAIHLLSQTHTPVYGVALAPRFAGLARALAAHMPPVPWRLLLHPAEQAGWCADLPPAHILHPPHASLHHADPACLVVGYSTTALIDAALAGHYVVAMEWPVVASLGARAVSCPPTRCADAEAVLALFQQLRESDSARHAMREAQAQWLAATFETTGQITHYVS